MMRICMAPLWSARYHLFSGGLACGEANVRMRMSTRLDSRDGVRLEAFVFVHLSRSSDDLRASEAIMEALRRFGDVEAISTTELKVGVTYNPWKVRNDVESCVRDALCMTRISSADLTVYPSRGVTEADVERFVRKVPHLLMLARSVAPAPDAQDDSFYYMEDMPWSILQDARDPKVIQNLMAWCVADRTQYDAVLHASTQGDPAKRSWVRDGTS